MSLERFHQAQVGRSGPGFAEALREIRAGGKRSHWIWYVLPQLVGLGHSAMAQRYGIADLAEAQVLLADPVLGPRLAEITAAIAQQLHAGVRLTALLGHLDARKAVSSLTLFEQAARELLGQAPAGNTGTDASSAPWIASFLAQAGTVMEFAEAQGLSRCPFTLARLGLVSPQPGPAAPP